VLFDNDRISIPELRASSPGGEARVTGEVALRELTLGDVQARLTAEDFTLLDQDGQSLIVDADVKVSGSTKAPVVAGAVDVDQFTWPIPQKPDKDVIDLDDAIFYVAAAGDTLAQRGPPPPGPWQQATVDVDVTIHHDAVLRNDKTLVAVQGDLSVDKRPGEAQPSIAGELTVTRGFYADFGKRFDVQRGDVRFFGTPEMNPGLDVEAVTQVTNSETGQDVTVTLTLGGTAKEPTLDFASTPAYDKSEIVSLLLFGTTTPGQGQQGRFEDTVGRLAAGQASAPLARALSSELGLDLLEIQPGIGTAGGAGFRAGKYISPDVFVTYQQGTGPLQETQLGIQYRLTRKLSLETQIGTRQGQQQVGGDVFYQFEY
jgi:translocation and assembly module TamB